MRYGRRSDQEPHTGAVLAWRDDQVGWVCSRSPAHFTIHIAIAPAAQAGVDRPALATPTSTKVLELHGMLEP
jgi:hypothetical protein